MDSMVLETQQWLNSKYGADSRFNRLTEDGETGWQTIFGLTRALQIEMGMTATADNFGSGTEAKFIQRWPSGIKEQKSTDKTKSNVYSIIQGALWCKGYSTGAHITQNFYSGTGKAIRTLKSDMGFGDGSTVDLEIMKALLSMKQFVLLPDYGGKKGIRAVQQQINAQYRSYTGVIPTDGVYAREMNTALIQVLQAIEGFSPAQATGNFGDGTRAKLLKLTSTNAASNPKWLWLATAALACNAMLKGVSSSWTATVGSAVKTFQKKYVLPVTEVVDTTTWMSLLTSKGDPNRKAVACDTRFEITTQLLGKLRVDGYQIVGRYLTEPDQEKKKPSEYFKAIRPGELERITEGGMTFFPIFQENARQLSDFTPSTGKRDGQVALKAAKRLKIPPTVIYFAVDMDALDYQVTSNILPYFAAVNVAMSGEYSVGIYASRNVCARILNAGFAASAFVSDMSTGFSGNLGFSIPDAWNYDQFTEISGYGIKWDLDRVAWSGAIAPVAELLKPGKSVVPPATAYTLPPKATAAEVRAATHVLQVVPLIRKLEAAWGKFILSSASIVEDRAVGRAVEVLNYLSKDYLKDTQFSVAVQPYLARFGGYVESADPALARALDRYFSNLGAERSDVRDDLGGMIDLAHMAVTALGYHTQSLAPDHWIGWAGDVATGMADLHNAKLKNPKRDTQQLANAMIGAAAYTAPYLKGANMTGVDRQCNFSDMCSDADAMALSRWCDSHGFKANGVSDFFSSYYKNLTWATRFSNYSADLGEHSTVTEFQMEVWRLMTGFFEILPKPGLLALKAGDSTASEKKAACNAFGSYVWSMLHN